MTSGDDPEPADDDDDALRVKEADEDIDWCIACCDGALTDDQRTELRYRISMVLHIRANANERGGAA